MIILLSVLGFVLGNQHVIKKRDVFNADDRMEVLDKHNQLRRSIGAANMYKLVSRRVHIK